MSNMLVSYSLHCSVRVMRTKTLGYSTFSLGRKEIIEILLEAGMDSNVFDHKKGEHH